MFWILLLISIVVLLSIKLIFCIAPGKMSPEAKNTAKIFYGLNCAHRGLHTENQQTPENSLSAFAAAHEKGYGTELDVHLSKDGQVVVFHDDDLKRACGMDDPINSLEWKELSAISLFNTLEKIPLLSDALEVLGDSPIIIELKPSGAKNAELCQKTLEILRKHGQYWCIESFDPRICAWFRKNAPDVLRGQLSTSPRTFKTPSKLKAFFLGNLLCNFISRPHFIAYKAVPHPLLVRLCYLMKPMTAAWTILPENDIAKLENENDTIIFEYYSPKPRYKK